jgi:hypothetical protein
MFETSAARLWKRLSREDRLLAAQRFFAEPPQETFGSAVAVLVKARHMRPQVARSLPPEEQARALASVLDVGEPVAASLLVSLHLGARRPLLAVFLDAAGLPHEEGLLKEEADSVPFTEENAKAGVRALAERFPRPEIETYLNTLWLQDPDRWGPLGGFEGWL